MLMPSNVLNGVGDYITDIRVILQDLIPTYRYSDAQLIVALNLTFLDGRRLRPDLFISESWEPYPTWTTNDIALNTVIPMEDIFRQAFVFGASAHAVARDQEDIQDEKSVSLSNVFNSILLGTMMPGSTPPKRKTP
jgi:hypothetical protein